MEKDSRGTRDRTGRKYDKNLASSNIWEKMLLLIGQKGQNLAGWYKFDEILYPISDYGKNRTISMVYENFVWRILIDKVVLSNFYSVKVRKYDRTQSMHNCGSFQKCINVKHRWYAIITYTRLIMLLWNFEILFFCKIPKHRG